MNAARVTLWLAAAVPLAACGGGVAAPAPVPPRRVQLVNATVAELPRKAAVTGVLAAPADLGDALARVILDDALRLRLGQAALERARTLTWDASALGIIRVLHLAAQ